MKKRILLIGYNFHPEPTGIGKYNAEMIEWLAQHGYDCTVLTTYPYYPHWRVQPPYDARKRRYTTEQLRYDATTQVTVHRVPMYVPAAPSGLKRIALDASFVTASFLRLLPLFVRQKFDVVITVVPPFHLGLLGVLCKKIWGCKLIYHVQDMQIEVAQNLNMIKSAKALNALYKLEKYIFNQADCISTISEGMVRRIAKKAQQNVLLFPNWSNTAHIYPLADRAALKEQFGLSAAHTVALYSGAIGEKQGLQAILLAAAHFAQHPALQFVICGSGPYKQQLELLAEQMQLTNVRFLPIQPIERLNELLNMADIHLVIQKADASDLVMPSKLTNILAAGGLALITANPESELYRLVDKYQMGVLVAAENQEALEEGLQFVLTQDTTALTEQARAYAKRYLSIDEVIGHFAQEAL